MTAQVGPDDPVLLGGHEQVIPSLLAADAHALEAEQGGVEVLDGRVPDQDLAAGHGGQADEAADLDVVAADPEPAAARRSTPSNSRTPVPIPEIFAPNWTSMLHRSWTCGSAAALRIRV